MTKAKELSPEAKAALQREGANIAILARRQGAPAQEATPESDADLRNPNVLRAIEAVADSADFSPFYKGEMFVTLTFRVPANTEAVPGIWHLTPIGPGTRDWAEEKFPPDDDE